nr:DUF3817 domain-containing protein [Acidipropionibacterium jensenii]
MKDVPEQHPVDDVTSDTFYETPDQPEASSGGSEPTQSGPDDQEPWILPDDIPAVRSALLRYRVMAYVVGTLLIVLVCVAMPLKYFADMPQMTSVVGVAHGWLYALLLITAYMLGRRAGWPLWRLAIIALAGTVPFLSFVAEHYARTDVNRRIAESTAYYSDSPEQA